MTHITLEMHTCVELSDLLEIQDTGHSVMAYGSFGLSPLNGGRQNFAPRDVDPAVAMATHNLMAGDFYRYVTNLNRAGIPFFLTFTNFFCSSDEFLHPQTEEVLDFLVRNSEFGVRNGVTVANPYLEKLLSLQYPDLDQISSCTRVYLQERQLNDRERVAFYNDSLTRGNYRLVVLSPTDSRRPDIISGILPSYRDKLVAVVNSPCTEGCNPHWHYKKVSIFNKMASYTPDQSEDRFAQLTGISHQYPVMGFHCQSDETGMADPLIEQLVKLGITHFKLGRGFIGDSLHLAYRVIAAAEKEEVSAPQLQR